MYVYISKVSSRSKFSDFDNVLCLELQSLLISANMYKVMKTCFRIDLYFKSKLEVFIFRTVQIRLAMIMETQMQVILPKKLPLFYIVIAVGCCK